MVTYRSSQFRKAPQSSPDVSTHVLAMMLTSYTYCLHAIIIRLSNPLHSLSRTANYIQPIPSPSVLLPLIDSPCHFDPCGRYGSKQPKPPPSRPVRRWRRLLLVRFIPHFPRLFLAVTLWAEREVKQLVRGHYTFTFESRMTCPTLHFDSSRSHSAC